MSVYGYIRVSTLKQAHSELGLRAQTHMIADYCKTRQKKLDRVFTDKAVSAFTCGMPDRPQGAMMMQSLKAGDHIVIAKMDRAFRSVIDFAATLAKWHARGVSVHLLDLGVDTTTPTGRMQATIMATIAEWESRRIGERIRDAVDERRRQGRAINGVPPIGYRQSRKIWYPNHAERRIARKIRDMRREGRSWDYIASYLHSRKITNRIGKPFTQHQMRRWAKVAQAKFPTRGLEYRRKS